MESWTLNPQFIIKSGFKSRAGCNGARTVVTIYSVPRIFQNFDDYPDFQQKYRGDRNMNNTVCIIIFLYTDLKNSIIEKNL